MSARDTMLQSIRIAAEAAAGSLDRPAWLEHALTLPPREAILRISYNDPIAAAVLVRAFQDSSYDRPDGFEKTLVEVIGALVWARVLDHAAAVRALERGPAWESAHDHPGILKP